LNLETSVSYNDKTFQIPIRREVGFYHLIQAERWMVDVLQLLQLEEDALFIDVGVNLGQTLLKVKAVYPEIRYIGFEPNTTCIEYVKNLAALNTLKHIELYPFALSMQSGKQALHFYNDPHSDPCASIEQSFRLNRMIVKSEDIIAHNLDSLPKHISLKNVSIIKIDVEGSEFDVLEVLRQPIQTNRPYILIEILPVYSSGNTFRLGQQEKIEEFLRDNNYTLYRIHHNIESVLRFEHIQDIGIHDNLDLCEYLCVPEESEMTLNDMTFHNVL